MCLASPAEPLASWGAGWGSYCLPLYITMGEPPRLRGTVTQTALVKLSESQNQTEPNKRHGCREGVCMEGREGGRRGRGAVRVTRMHSHYTCIKLSKNRFNQN